jgi:hypothetical protein
VEKMTREEKIISIKAWLQMFGDRDNECFYIEVIVNEGIRQRIWTISMQYNYDLEEGFPIEPYNWCRYRFEENKNKSISDRSDIELDEIIKGLNEIKVCW